MEEILESSGFFDSSCRLTSASGTPVSCTPVACHRFLKPHQRLEVQWAVRGGRRALFEAFGLGKTVQQLEILRLTLKHADCGKPGGKIECVIDLMTRGRKRGFCDVIATKRISKLHKDAAAEANN